MHTIRFITFLVFILTALPAIFLVVDPALSVHILWDWANAIGYIASGLILVLFIYTGQRRRFQKYNSKFYSTLHEHLGIVTLLLVLLHVGILLSNDSILLEHLKLTAPYYMLSGLFASVLLAILAISALQPLRRKIWDRRISFRVLHGVGGMGVLLFTGIHIVNSHYYANTPLKIIILFAISTLVITVYLINKFKRFNFSDPPVQLNTTIPVIICYTSFLLLTCTALLYAYIHNSG